MRNRAAALLLPVLLPLLVSLIPAVVAKDEESPKNADQELQKLINQAIDRGAKWLLARQDVGGSFSTAYRQSYPMGGTAIATLALLHSGVPRGSFEIKKAFAYLRSAYARAKGNPGPWSGLKTYSVSVTIMVLAEYGRVGRTAKEHDERYGGAAGAGFRLEKPDLEWMKEMTAWLVSVQQSSGAWRYPQGGFDHSNTQYALLALKEARRSGIEVPEETFAKALRHFLGAQQKSGSKVKRRKEVGGDGVYAAQREVVPGYDRSRGWGYTGPNPATGSMTTAGVAAVAIAKSELRHRKHRKLVAAGLQSVRDGVAWLGLNFSVTANPHVGVSWHYYYLYGLERAGVLADVVYMGSHRWYAEGAKYLVNVQRPDGAWGGAVDHSFALLFLARATARSVGTMTEKPLLDLTGGGRLSERAHRDLFQAALREMDRLSEEAAKVRARDFAFLGPRVIPLLLPLLLDVDRRKRTQAALILRSVTGLDFGYDSAGPTEKRELAADAWTGWYLKNRSALALDREARRIR